jgi:hypothetical protein
MSGKIKKEERDEKVKIAYINITNETRGHNHK